MKGRKYIGTETKYYFADVGIRAAILNYRQQEETHIMENIIYNELRSRGYNVDVGLVELGGKDENGKFVRIQLEVDFVVNRPPSGYISSRLFTCLRQKRNSKNVAHYCQSMTTSARLSLSVMTFIAKKMNSAC